MSALKINLKHLMIAVLFVGATQALAQENQSLKPQTPSNQEADVKATHIKAKVLDGGSELDGATDRSPSTTEDLPYPDEEIKNSDPSPSSKNMPVDQD